MNLVILGGGTAGWLTALFVQKKLPGHNITLIESSEIGILGAGEGTTPHIVELFRELDLPLVDIIKEADGTIKNGIKFTNWNGDGHSYFHPFFDECSLLDDPVMVGERINNGKNLDNLVPSHFLSSINKVKFKYSREINDVVPWGSVALHFDARKLAAYLKTFGVKRGVQLIDSKVIDIKQSLIGDIESLTLENGDNVPVDFIFDCSGFKRLIIGKLLKSEWRTYKDSIPNKKAMPFFIPSTSNSIPPYTEAIAMKYGWVWKIPVQGRFGCGYVYDSDHVSEEEIREEIYSMFGPVETPKVFEFEPGCFKEIWKNNCLALGLASGFIEPLEATSIWVTIVTLRTFLNNITGVINNDQRAKDTLNRGIYELNEDVLTFIYLHYITQRKDTEYWCNFCKNNKQPEKFNALDRSRQYIDFINLGNTFKSSFDRPSVLAVAAGGGFFDKLAGKDLATRYSIAYPIDRYKKYLINTSLLHENARECLDHKNFLNKLKDL